MDLIDESQDNGPVTSAIDTLAKNFKEEQNLIQEEELKIIEPQEV